MTVYVASDHAGFALKEALLPLLREELGVEVIDCGAHTFEEGDDYPDLIAVAARAVSEQPEGAQALVLGGSGQGEAIVANRFPHVRAIVFNGQYAPRDGREVPHEIETARQHNDANVLSLGARFLSEEEAKEAVRFFFTTPFSGDERHVRRIAKIEQYP